MITIEQYFGRWSQSPDASPGVRANAERLLLMVNGLLDRAMEAGINLPVNPGTGSQVSGAEFGGFRPQWCPQGAAASSHKIGRGVDVFDPHNDLDNWLTDGLLTDAGLYREHPSATDTWCHLTDRAPPSKRRSFYP